ncbi:MAG TPA: PTS system mannose/fructose/sorbose family transporter subunit IID [Gemmatimonadales bacterium]|nr:PTS system mannose/fructose/sorbose family transporter subunit IID [Gemmatimonadales bacterium]
MRGQVRTLFRLLGVQSGWTYERMGGIGVAFALTPLLQHAVPPERRAAAQARAAEFFNSHPWLAGLAVGAEARAESDGVAPEQIQRLRTALGGPLGALGDRVIWAGLIPILSALALIGGGLYGWTVPLVAVLIALVVRLEVTRWALTRGLGAGMRVAQVLKECALSRLSRPLSVAAAGAVGAATMFVGRGAAARVAPEVPAWLVLVGGGVALAAVLKGGARLPAYRLALLAGGLALILTEVVRP